MVSLDLLHLLVGNVRVIFHQLLLMSLEKVIAATMSLSMSMFGAVDISTLAWSLHQSYFPLAFPTLVCIALYNTPSIFVNCLSHFNLLT